MRYTDIKGVIMKNILLNVFNTDSETVGLYLLVTRRHPLVNNKNVEEALVSLHRIWLQYKCSWQITNNYVNVKVIRSWREEEHTVSAASLFFIHRTRLMPRLLQLIRYYPLPKSYLAIALDMSFVPECSWIVVVQTTLCLWEISSSVNLFTKSPWPHK